MLKEYNKIRTEIKKLNSTTIETDTLYKIRSDIHTMYENTDFSNKDEIKRIRALSVEREKEYDNAKNHNKRVLLTVKVLENNAKTALKKDIAPVLMDVVNAYKNKPYGEKTKQKIHDEMKTRVNCSVYLYDNYIQINPLNENGYSVSYDYINLYVKNGVLTNDNKIIELCAKNFIFDDLSYIDDPRAHVEKIINEYDALLKLHNALETALDNFNDLCIGNLKTISKTDVFYNTYLDFYY